MRALIAGILVLAALAGSAAPALSHALQPGYLELEALGGDQWRAFWRKPAVAGRPMQIDARLPAACVRREGPEPHFDGAAWVVEWVTRCPGGLKGGKIAIRGLEATQTDVLVSYELEPGQSSARRLTAQAPAFTVPTAPGVAEVLWSYFTLGVEHILQGADHLLFVFALLLLIRDRWLLIGAVTAFTAAHSLTLAAAVLGWVVLPSPPVEAVVALSIMFLASELTQQQERPKRLSERYPWVVSFVFGLLHGLGFASALREIGLPEGEVPAAVLAFNLGVEAGQLLFVGSVVLAGATLRALASVARAAHVPAAGYARQTFGYAIGGISAYWFVARVAAF